MRLIDADEAKKQVKQMQTLNPSERMLFRMALDRTPTYEPPNDPLTLEELREMDWDPAWAEGAELGRNGRKGYAILWYSKVEKYLCVWWPCEEYADIPRLELYGKTWRVFRRKPEET